MPTYEYRCRNCGEHLEVVQSFKDDPLTECPNCAGELRKVFSPIGIAFKGSGFYRNDSRGSSSSTTSSGAEKSDAATTSSSSAGSEKSTSSSSSSDSKAASA
jgi:putative FmdB family regulatory protein